MVRNSKRVLVIGSGGREHALCWKLAQSPRVHTVYAAPGSYGIEQEDKVINVANLDIKDFSAVSNWCSGHNIDLIVIGPEDPLAAGIVNKLRADGFRCFGPPKEGARIEWDKDWSKQFMVKYGIPTARYQSFTDVDKAKEFINSASYPALVVKASGLAAGKGVIVAADKKKACSAVEEILGNKKFGAAGETVVIEEILTGEEISVLGVTDGKDIISLLPAQDHKRIRDNDEGPNTGGMGAYCPCPLVSPEEFEFIKQEVLQKAVDGLQKEGINYCGIIYAGMMLTPEGPKTIEFNCRFGDPETQVILPLLDSDLYSLFEACCVGDLHSQVLKWKSNVFAVGVVMASAGYPESSTKGSPITGLKGISKRQGHFVFHSGIAHKDNQLVTNGGRVLIVVSINGDLRDAAHLAKKAVTDINFTGRQYRNDIAHKAFKMYGGLSYKDSGVDIEAGDLLVQKIKPLAISTNRSGVQGGLGGFGGLFRLNEVCYTNEKGEKVRYKDPILVQGTDGVGTKLKVAEEIGNYNSIGIDLVAMCVNDILCAGAEPLAFLDYLACGKLDVPTAVDVVKGIATACKYTGCALLGGETAEMPSMYDPGKYDMAGFCVGVVENDEILPKTSLISPGDLVIGLPSSGVHSNGFSLVRKVMLEANEKYRNKAAFSTSGKTYGEEFLKPTRLYVSAVLPALRKKLIKAMAHITGGGLLENIPRILPPGVKVNLDANEWSIPPVFGWLAAKGNISDYEMQRTFNCGIGLVMIIRPEARKELFGLLNFHGATLIGYVESSLNNSDPQVVIKNFRPAIDHVANPYRKKDAIQKQTISYKDSGVDIVAGDSLVSRIKPFAKATNRNGVIGGLGGFGGLFRLAMTTYTKTGKETKYNDPVLVMGTDGVGTKLKIAQEMGIHNTVGIDLVAMCVNDILCNGAEPLTFLDYYACGKLDVDVAEKVIEGIAEGCKQSGSVLLGGETAEMPGMYAPGVYDLAGYSLGVVEHTDMLPLTKEIVAGDLVIGLPSSGVHSNGFSLVHRVLEKQMLTLHDSAPFSILGKKIGEELLTPTKIYVKAVLPAIRHNLVKALAHITGGGLTENIPRVLSDSIQVELDATKWNIPPVFGWLADKGKISDTEMLRTFNCGIGMILIVSPELRDEVLGNIQGNGATVIGKVINRIENEPQVTVKNFSNALTRVQKIITAPKKKVGVLISGTGSNLQALIDATRDSVMGIGAEIVLVISNKANVFGLERAEKAGIPTKVLNHKDFKSREEFDLAMMEELDKYAVELVCLAGFMRILSSEFVSKWKGKLINVHPALLPKFKGTHGQRQALESGDKITGCTVHFVDEGVDTGATIVQEVVPILPDDTEETLSLRINKAEHQAFPRALRMLCTEIVCLGEDSKLVWK